MDRVVVGVDGSDASRAAVHWCAAHLEPGTTVVAVCSIELPFDFGTVPAVWYVPSASVAQALREQWCAPLRRAGLQCDCRLVDGPHAVVLREIAAQERADALIVGKRCHRGVLDVFFGAVARRLIRRPPCPVIVVPAPSRPGRAGRRAAERTTGGGHDRSTDPPMTATLAEGEDWSRSRIVMVTREGDVVVLDCLVAASAAGGSGVPPPLLPATVRLSLPRDLGTAGDIEQTLNTWVDDGSLVDLALHHHSGVPLVQIRHETSGVTLELEQAALPH